MRHPFELSVVLPCYNESRGLEAILDRFAMHGSGVSFELILVDNGSTDDTSTVLERLLSRYPFARSVRIEENRGYGHGLFTGLQAASAPFLAWSHADLQTDPADVFRAFRLVQDYPQPERVLVKGRRHGRSLSERVVSMGMQTLATLILLTPLSEINAQPKVFSRDLLDRLDAPPADFNFDLYVLLRAKRAGWRVLSFPVQFPPRPFGVSHWASTWRSKVRTMSRSAAYMFRLGLTRESSYPLPAAHSEVRLRSAHPEAPASTR